MVSITILKFALKEKKMLGMIIKNYLHNKN